MLSIILIAIIHSKIFYFGFYRSNSFRFDKIKLNYKDFMIKKNKELVYEHTSKWNYVAIVSDGSRVLGLGDIGPEAGMPVMEGKALLFKYLGGVDAFPWIRDWC